MMMYDGVVKYRHPRAPEAYKAIGVHVYEGMYIYSYRSIETKRRLRKE